MELAKKDATVQYIVERQDEDDGMKDIRVLTADELAAYLRKNIESDHYSSYGDLITGMWRWDGSGKMTKVFCRYVTEHRTGNDYLIWDFIIVPAKPEDRGAGPEFEFSVEIDGRA